MYISTCGPCGYSASCPAAVWPMNVISIVASISL